MTYDPLPPEISANLLQDRPCKDGGAVRPARSHKPMTEERKPLYIFDLDGTLALIDHRKHLLDATDSQKWRRFYAACDRDEPNAPVIRIMESLRRFAEIWIFSGRSSEVRQKTVDWLCYHTSFMAHELDTALVMRDEGDYTADDELKASWLDSMLNEDITRLVAVFDDRDRVVRMWRSRGITCLQVADGDF